MFRIGIIGYGGRMSGVVDRIVETGKAMPVAIADPDTEGAKRRAAERNFTEITYYTDAEEMLRSEELDGICIGTRCSLHTRYALLAAQYGVPVFLEKPVSITEAELDQLRTLEENCAYAAALAPYITHIHVFNWEGPNRYPLAEGTDLWKRYLRILGDHHTLLLEFMPDDDPRSLPREADALRAITGGCL